MIRVVIGKQTYVLRWDGKQWEDKAGHVWDDVQEPRSWNRRFVELHR